MKVFLLGLWVLLTGMVHAEFQFQHRWNDYATHQPVLYEAVMSTSGPIIEFGCGNGSTDMLHEICKRTNRILVSVEDDLDWMNRFTTKYLGDGYEEDNSGWHKFFYVPGKPPTPPEGINDPIAQHWVDFFDQFDLLDRLQFDVCFVDQSPGSARTVTIRRFKDKVRLFVLHDCDCFVSGELGYSKAPMDPDKFIPGVYDFSKTFKYFEVFFPLAPWPGRSGPPTLLGSNFEPHLPKVDYDKYGKPDSP
jgi:hypothetical protein